MTCVHASVRMCRILQRSERSRSSVIHMRMACGDSGGRLYYKSRDMIPEWAKEMNCAVTVCDKEGVIVYMNDKAKETFASHGDLVGKSLIPCHSERSRGIIAELLRTSGSNAYTIQKNGLRKMIYQTAWKENG